MGRDAVLWHGDAVSTTRKDRGGSLAAARRRYIFGKARTLPPLAREEICGAEYILDIVEPSIELLRMFQDDPRGHRRTFPGILLWGPSGIGKTFLARYIGSASGARMIVAEHFPRATKEDAWSERDIESLFALTREYVAKMRQPVVLFIDHLDRFSEAANTTAFGRFLTEIDGLYGKLEGVLLIGATTKEPEDLGAELVRAERFGVHVHFYYPGKLERKLLLRHYFDRFPHDDIPIEDLALHFDEKTPADIKQLVHRMRDLAETRGRKLGTPPRITRSDVVRAFTLFIIGTPDPTFAEFPGRMKHATAAHELGHAIVAYLLGWTVHIVHIIPTQTTLGETHYDTASGFLETREEILGKVATCLGGRIAEEICETGGAAGAISDIEIATKFAKKLVDELGLGRTKYARYGLSAFDEKERGSDRLRRETEEDIARILKDAEKRVRAMLGRVGRGRLERLADILLERKMILGDEFLALMKEHGITRILASSKR